MLENNIVHHTFQPKEDRAYRVVIKHMHHFVDPMEIKEELEKLGHPVSNIVKEKTGESSNRLTCSLSN